MDDENDVMFYRVPTVMFELMRSDPRNVLENPTKLWGIKGGPVMIREKTVLGSSYIPGQFAL